MKPPLRFLSPFLALAFCLSLHPGSEVRAQDAGGGHGTAERESLYDLGLEAFQERRYSRAAEYLERAAKLDPNNMELLYWDPNGESDWSLYALENVAEIYVRTDSQDKARDAYLKALQRETREPWRRKIQNMLAEIDLAKGRLKPDEHTRLNEKGEIVGGVGLDLMRTNRNFEIARQTNRPEKEAKYYRLAVDTDPGMYQPYFNLGLALVKLGRYEGAIPWFEESEKAWKADTVFNPDGTDKGDSNAFLALCHLELGDPGKAHLHAQKALAVDDTYFWSVLYAQRVRVARGEAGVALPILEGLASDNPEEPETLHALSEAYRAVGRHKKAGDALAEAVRVIPDNHPWMVRLKKEWSAILSENP
jgi:tetratricopeptide (TPR) repeat protein